MCCQASLDNDDDDDDYDDDDDDDDYTQNTGIRSIGIFYAHHNDEDESTLMNF